MGRGTSVLGTDKRKADLDAKGVHMSGELEKLILGDIDVEINPSESTEERDVYNCLKTLYGSREGEQAHGRDHPKDKKVRTEGTSAGSKL